jgi:hypothetical protein
VRPTVYRTLDAGVIRAIGGRERKRGSFDGYRTPTLEDDAARQAARLTANFLGCAHCCVIPASSAEIDRQIEQADSA